MINLNYKSLQVELYDTDPLVWHGGLTARFCKEMCDAILRISKTFKSIEWPYLLMHSDNDKLCEFNASVKFHSATRSNDKLFKVRIIVNTVYT